MPAGVHLFVTIFTVQCLKVPDEGLKKRYDRNASDRVIKTAKTVDKQVISYLLAYFM